MHSSSAASHAYSLSQCKVSNVAAELGVMLISQHRCNSHLDVSFVAFVAVLSSATVTTA